MKLIAWEFEFIFLKEQSANLFCPFEVHTLTGRGRNGSMTNVRNVPIYVLQYS